MQFEPAPAGLRGPQLRGSLAAALVGWSIAAFADLGWPGVQDWLMSALFGFPPGYWRSRSALGLLALYALFGLPIAAAFRVAEGLHRPASAVSAP